MKEKVTTKKTEFVIGAKNVVINVDTNSLSMKVSNINAIFQKAQMKTC